MSKAFLFIQQVLEEGRKIVWPTRKDVVLSSIIVLIFALIFGFFLAVADEVIIRLLKFIMGFNS